MSRAAMRSAMRFGERPKTNQHRNFMKVRMPKGYHEKARAERERKNALLRKLLGVKP